MTPGQAAVTATIAANPLPRNARARHNAAPQALLRPSKLIHLETFHRGQWHLAGEVTFARPDAGVAGGTRFSYTSDYWYQFGLPDAPRDERAVSVTRPVTLDPVSYDTWPGFLVDLLPQGFARARIAKTIPIDRPAAAPALDLPLLLKGGGSPIGNLRIREAWESERDRLAEIKLSGTTDQALRAASGRFLDQASALIEAAGASNTVQGEWPKLLLTKSSDGLWYPDAAVDDHDAREHALVKLKRGSTGGEFDLILRAEAVYWSIAKDFGLRVGARPSLGPNALVIPRFDRERHQGQVARLGQESLYSAVAIVQPGATVMHETYLRMLADVASDPATEIIEYVLRDLLAIAMGDTDNHGRNTALQKRGGRIGLAPLFDFCPMVLHPDVVAPSTRWACLSPGGRYLPCEIAAAVALASDGILRPEGVLAALKAKIPFLRRLKTVPEAFGLAPEIAARALVRCSELIEVLDAAAPKQA